MTDLELQEYREASFAKVSNTIEEYSANAINHDKAIFRYGFDCAIELMRKENEKLIMKLNTLKNDYWFIENLIERYSYNKDETLNDILQRIKFRKPLFNNQ